MATIDPFAVRDDQWTDYVVQNVCNEITVCEVGQQGTTDYYFRSPITSSGTGRLRPAGKELTIKSSVGFKPNDKPFSLKLAPGGVQVNFDGVEL